MTPGRLGRIVIVLLGIVLGQALLYGPSLVGRKILLPLDILEQPHIYMPTQAGQIIDLPHNRILIDLVCLGEPARRFAAGELHAGRFPLWNPHQYAGAPVAFSSFSPFTMLGACSLSPLVIPWIQMAVACIAGVGAYCFFRRGLDVSFWPAAIVAWCYPLTAFFVLWQGYGVEYPVVWLPWSLLAVQLVVQKRSAYGCIGIAVITCLTLVSGNLDVAGQVLLVSGLYAVFWHLFTYRKQCFSREGIGTLGTLTLAWVLGFMLAAPCLLPGLEYARTGSRMAQRSRGHEERPPIGLSALPEVVMPNIYGTDERESYPNYPKGQGNLPEGASSAYAGIFATLLAAPLAFFRRRSWMLNGFWVFMILFALSWSINLRPVVALLRMPGLNMMSHNRLVFAASFAILALAATGLDELWRGEVCRRWWFGLPMLALATIYLWSMYRSISLPEPLATQLAASVTHSDRINWVNGLEQVDDLRRWFVQHYRVCATLSGAGLACWLLFMCWKPNGRLMLPVMGVLLAGDLLWFGCGRSAQCDPALYYPRIDVLDAVAKASSSDRVIGYKCLPSRLAEMCGLSDVRGYDAIDPARYMDLMGIAADPRSPVVPYALTQNMIPKARLMPPDNVLLSPVLDMLGVRFVIFRGSQPPAVRPVFHGQDYWVLENHSALPRAFVPARVETVADDEEQLKRMASPQFDPRKVAYVESAVNLPESVQGAANIVDENPTHVSVSVQMESAGLLVLADLWDPGWHAYVNGSAAPILRANHALRGVMVPAGTSRVMRGFLIFGITAMTLGGWAFLIARRGGEGRRDEGGKKMGANVQRRTSNVQY